MQKIYKTAIIGGGSAGLMTAIELLSDNNALKGEQIALLERNDRVGKKLVATGNGQGNLCNADFSADFYHGEKGFIRTFVEQYNAINLEKYLFNLGIPLALGQNGKKYPLSKQASSALDIMRAYISNKGCKELINNKAEKISFDGKLFSIYLSDSVIQAENVVLAFGGKSASQFGTDGTSYSLAESFGHKTTKLYPSLVQLKTEMTNIRGLKGLKENVRITAFDGDYELKDAFGEILFTEYGVSGNAVFQISSQLAGATNPRIRVEFLPEFSIQEIIEILVNRERLGFLTGENYLNGIVNKRIGQAVLKTVKNINSKSVANALKNFELKVTGNLGFNYSQVTRGGIETSHINPYTMESKLQKGLYIVGEALDIDGDCGGYNLTFAFVSGIISARSIKNKFSN